MCAWACIAERDPGFYYMVIFFYVHIHVYGNSKGRYSVLDSSHSAFYPLVFRKHCSQLGYSSDIF